MWAADVGAYAVGRSVGGPRLAPKISPNKTWSGLVGGLVAATLSGVFLAGWLDVAFLPGSGAMAAVVLGVIAQGGDLFESALKRRCGVKDSGRMIPGHGGLLDRVDSLLAAAPVAALMFWLWEGMA